MLGTGQGSLGPASEAGGGPFQSDHELTSQSLAYILSAHLWASLLKQRNTQLFVEDCDVFPESGLVWGLS